jgi:hypothetical protein
MRTHLNGGTTFVAEIILSGGMSVPKIISAVEGVVGLGDHGCAAKDS